MKVRPSVSSISKIVQIFAWFSEESSFDFSLKTADGLPIVGEFVEEELQGDVATEFMSSAL